MPAPKVSLDHVPQLPDGVNARIILGEEPHGDENVEGTEAWLARQVLDAAYKRLRARHLAEKARGPGTGKTASIRVTQTIRTSPQSFLRE